MPHAVAHPAPAVSAGTADPDDQLLQDFLRGDESARVAFPAHWQAHLRAMARSHATELRHHDLFEAEDVEQETLLSLLRTPAGVYDPSRGPAKAFVRLKVRNSIKLLRARLRPAGLRSHSGRYTANESLDRELESGEDPVTIGEIVRDDRYDLEMDVERKELIGMALATADAETAEAMRAMLDGRADSLTKAADIVGLSRYALHRRFEKLRAWLPGAV